MQISILIYSGRENPCWTVSDDQEEKLILRLKGLGRSHGGGPQPLGLGYQGIEIRVEQQSREPQLWRIYGGFAQTDGEWFRDTQRELERLILAMSREALGSSMPENLQ